MLPLSFREYTEVTGAQGDAAFAEYLKYGGLPYVASMEKTEEKVSTYLEGIYNTVIVKEIEDRQSRKESAPDKRQVTDITLLKTIARYLASVIGSQVSVKSVADYLTSNGRKVSPNTVDRLHGGPGGVLHLLPGGAVRHRGETGPQRPTRSGIWWTWALRGHILPRRNYDLGFSHGKRGVL